MISALFGVLATHGGRVRVDWDKIDESITGEQLTGEDLLAAGFLMIVGITVSFLIGRWRRRLLGKLEFGSGQLVGLIIRLVQVLVLAVFVGWALTTLGSDIGWLTLMVLVGLLVAVLAARPVLEGLGASAALVTRPAFSVGDEIAVDDVTGEVLEITNRSTVIRLRDGRRVHIPNVEMLSKTVTVYTVDGERRSAFELTVGMGNDIDDVERVIRDALGGIDTITRVGSIRARRITVGIDLSIRFWHPPGLQDGNDALDDAIRAVKTALEREGIDLAASSEVAIVDTAAARSADGEHRDQA